MTQLGLPELARSTEWRTTEKAREKRTPRRNDTAGVARTGEEY